MSTPNPSNPDASENFGFQNSDRKPNPIELKLDRIDELASLLVDDAITDDQVTELEQLLTSDADARGRYVENMALHADLIEYFRPAEDTARKTPSPVLGMLGPDDNGLALPPVNPADQPE